MSATAASCSEPLSKQNNPWRKVVKEHICWLRFGQKGQQDRGLNHKARSGFLVIAPSYKSARNCWLKSHVYSYNIHTLSSCTKQLKKLVSNGRLQITLNATLIVMHTAAAARCAHYALPLLLPLPPVCIPPSLSLAAIIIFVHYDILFTTRNLNMLSNCRTAGRYATPAACKISMVE